MAKKPAFQFYASDWLGSTKHAMMSPAERGAYIDLLCHQWNDPDCSLPDDDAILAVLSGLNEGWCNGGCTLVRECFPKVAKHPTRIANKRLREVRAISDEWSRKSREGGIKSGAVRRAKSKRAKTCVDSTDSDKAAKGALGVVEPPLKPPSPSPSPSPCKDIFPAEFVTRWNATAGVRKIRGELSESRRGTLKTRLKNAGWWDQFGEALRRQI